MKNSGRLPTAPLPAAYRQHAANLARWFPEVLLALGAPGLEESFEPFGPHVTVDPSGQTIEVVLERRLPHPSAVHPSHLVAPAAPAASSSTSLSARLAGLEALALDFEALAAGHAAPPVPPVSPASGYSPLQGTSPLHHEGLLRRLDTAAQDILTLSSQLQAAGSPPPTYVAPVTLDCDRPVEAPTKPVAPPATAPALRTPLNASVAPKAAVKQLAESSNGMKRHASLPSSCSAPSGQDVLGTAPAGQDVGGVKELTPCTPGSARGDRQVHQGMSARQTGRSRTSPAKAALWRTQRDSLMTISINKVPQLKEEPASPKFQKPTKVWGSANKTGRCSARRASYQAGEPCEDRSAVAIKQRIDRKLALLFGDSKINRSNSISSDFFRTK